MGEFIEFELANHNMDLVSNVFGNLDKNIRLIEDYFDVSIVFRENNMKIVGDRSNVNKAKSVIDNLINIAEKRKKITSQDVYYIISLVNEEAEERISDYMDIIYTTSKGKPVKTLSIGQKKYVKSIQENSITFGIGPAGTGKTYIAVALAVRALRNKEVEKIVLTRPAVEAGEKLGYLPGDLQEKINPYLQPLYDALYDLIGVENCQKYLERGIIEVIPLAYMRGRTLDNSFIILDEAQNTTPEQMKMFLTRLGVDSKAVITGDVTQIDLPKDKVSGIVEAEKVLKGIEGIKFVRLDEKDVVRHELVQKIIKAYAMYENRK